MSLDLAVDELEAVAGIGDPFPKAGSQFGEQVPMFESGGFGVLVQLGDLAGKQCVPFGIEFGDVALGVTDLPRDSQKLGGYALAGNGGVDLAVIVEETLQGFRVATVVGLISAGHEQGEVLLLGLVAREVRMDALGDLAKEGLEAGRRIELLGFAGRAECGIVGLLRTLAGIFSSAAGGVGFVEVDFALGDARFKIVQLRVEKGDLPEITPFKSLKLGAELGELRFPVRQLHANGSELLPLIKEVEIVPGLLEDDFGWHAAYRF